MEEFFNYTLVSLGDAKVSVLSIAIVLFALVIAKVAVYLSARAFNKSFGKRKVSTDRQNSMLQIVRYVIYIMTFFFILDFFDVSLKGIAIGSGALLVGVGIGLQQTFNDVFSGIIMLFEGSVTVNDKILIEPKIICRVKRIGLRTTEVLTLDNMTIIIPNSQIVTNRIVNWSHNRKAARFYIDVGVAYSSDIKLVEEVLLKSLNGQEGIDHSPAPSVQLINYGDSSVDFRLYFYSSNFFVIQRIQSDVRKKVFEELAIAGIEIPFPQRDLWLKTPLKE